MTDLENKLHSIAELLVSYWFKEQCRDTTKAFYLYCRKARQGESIAVPIITENAPNEDFFLGMNERISPAWTKETAKTKILEAMRKAPILGS